ncbi:YIP1 family protein [Paenibacillus sp. LHD-117]|uniref:YIP1 family protein n=1 Tax=Paenibacillus sp. LHD-117 TaxID=3071412 RepID=UPI0027E0F5FE|nr:YIP1 family protein [Paenibacillus sp. LHD-117]MDQ6417817.1 YIP1 family protein [Paenibacillus sp. LHD-117]
MRRFILMLLLAGVAAGLLPQAVHAQLPYRTGYYDANQSTWLRLQPIYEPADIGGVRLGEPADVHVAADDTVYVVDKAGNQVAVLDQNGQVTGVIGDAEGNGQLNAPQGVYVSGDGEVYVADSGNQRIAVFGKDGTYSREYRKPESSLLGGVSFIPTKLVVDRRGVMYISLNSAYQGLVRLSPEGEFKGFFGANKAKGTVMSWIKKLVLNKEQMAQEQASLPLPVVNVAADKDGFLLTATAGSFGSGAIRKLNAGGVDAFKNKTLLNGHGIVDVVSDENGFLYSADTDSEGIDIYDEAGNALFHFGLIDKETQQFGVIGFPTGIAVDSKFNIWVADGKTGTVHKFVRTDFGTDVLSALALYRQGRYEESEAAWDRVYARNDMYNGTFQGLGKAYLQQGDYNKALRYLRTAFDTDNYSDAFWQIRLRWLQQHFVWAALIAVTALAAIWFAPRLAKRLLRRYPPPASWERPLEELRIFRTIMFHPYEGFYKLKESKVSAKVIFLLLAAVVGVKIADVYLRGFLFNPVELSQVNLMSELAWFAVPWLTWIIANYLVCSVRDGEGRFREVIQGSTFALAPYLFLSVPLIVLSNVVTLDERVIIDALNAAMLLWTAAMLIVMTQVIHNYDFAETLKNTGLTAFAIGIIWVFVLIVSGLTYNLYDFFYQLYKEATFIG